MATYTSNYNLEKPEATDPFGDFRESYNDNLDIIDANLGGGGGGGGHTIVDENGSDMPAESKLQFTGNVSVSDDNVNGATVVDVLGGGGNVYGAFIDTSNVIASGTVTAGVEGTYTATEDVALDFLLYASGGQNAYLRINGTNIFSSNSGTNRDFVFLKKGQTATFGSYGTNGTYTVYGLTEGTNGIFAPVIYSDTERKIGVWRDNKPLYAKTVSFTTGNTSGYLNYLTDIENPETMMIDFGGSFYMTGTAKVPAMAYFGTLNASADTNAFAVLCNVDNGYLRLDYRVGTSAYSKTAYVTVLYTKTTDVAGSGDYNTYGVPTVHYDNTEKVIGTYLGKPLYQITYSGLSLVCTNANQSYATNIDWGNIEKAVHSDIIDHYGQSCAGSVIYTGTPAKLGVSMQMANRTVTDITIQYTKTTD